VKPYVVHDCNAGVARDMHVAVDRDVLVYRQSPRSKWIEPMARLQPNEAVAVATQILRRFAPSKLAGE
jgi:hypothetical protein